ncbi:ribonuclease 1-like [Vicia villosa]|uniref:ribonuclease 1-like n=1 Tax=Vicia villosa TaxID=3911 RepID=UPI00273AC152|nr:ribonuclease 1-like [Vicia villosa]
MNKLLSFIVFLSLFLSSAAYYEFFILSMQWPPAYCRAKSCVQNPSRFSIHGMWPANKTNPQPSKCFNNDQAKTTLNRNMISATASAELPTSWPNLVGDNFEFWEREWLEHGTCSYSTFNQTQYFDQANTIWKGLQLFDILQKDGISPSTTEYHKRADFEMAIGKAIGKQLGDKFRIEFHCSEKNPELLEIRLCRNHAGSDYTGCKMYGNCGSTFKWKP